MQVSIIIPAYNCLNIVKEQIVVLESWVLNWKFSTEIIIVIDGNFKQEDYSKLSKNTHHIKIVGYRENKGKGFAIKEGFKYSKGAFILYTDADIPFSESSYKNVMEELIKANKNTWVIGDRTLPESEYFEKTSWVRKIGSDIFLRIIKWTLGNSIADTQCGLKGFTRESGGLVLNKSFVNRFAFDYECLFIAKQKNIKIKKVPVALRNQSKSSVNVFRDGIKLFIDVFYINFINKYD